MAGSFGVAEKYKSVLGSEAGLIMFERLRDPQISNISSFVYLLPVEFARKTSATLVSKSKDTSSGSEDEEADEKELSKGTG